MPRPVANRTKEELEEMKKIRNDRYYYEGNGKEKHRIRYLMKKNDIKKEELENMTINEQLEYCGKKHAENKYKREMVKYSK